MGEHDQLFKRAFRVPANAAGELLSVLPTEVLELVELGSVALAETDLVGEKLGELFSDALFTARFRGVPGYIWFLIEHQSTPARFMVLRVLGYVAEAWMNFARQRPEPQRLPPIVCVIVYHGEAAWNAPKRLHDVIDGVEHVPALHRFVPDFELIVDDLVQRADEELKSRPLPVFAKVVLWMLRDARTIQRLLDRIGAWGDELRLLTREDMTTIVRYLLKVVGDDSFEQVRRRIIEVAPHTEEVMTTAAESLIARGEARILDSRDIAELERWLRRAVTVSSAAELFSR
jgi:hypothetical protein